MKDPRLSFVNNMSTALEVFRGKHAPVAFMLARIPYETVEDRDAIIGAASVILGGEASGAA